MNEFLLIWRKKEWDSAFKTNFKISAKSKCDKRVPFCTTYGVVKNDYQILDITPKCLAGLNLSGTEIPGPATTKSSNYDKMDAYNFERLKKQ